MAEVGRGPLSEWLQLMLAEIAAKREDLERARVEEQRRQSERAAGADVEPHDAPRG